MTKERIPIPIGTVYGKFTVQDVIDPLPRGWLVAVRCECGNVEYRQSRVLQTNVKAGKTPQCTQCNSKRQSEHAVRTHTKHGLHKSRLYRIWDCMIARCYNHKNRNYHNYGGRGIGVCDKWRTFVGFSEDMQPTYQDGLELDRIDNNGNYNKPNCRWVPHRDNMRNKRGCLTEVDLVLLAKETGIHLSTLRHRVRAGWPVESLTIPPTHKNACVGLKASHTYERLK